jgi:hypothetical protein
MKADAQKTQTDEEWLRDCFEYEATHPIAFASPRALLEARMIEAMDKARRPRRAKRRAAAPRGKPTVA